ncbi:polyphosphate kinase 1 [soil metagenome]
MAGQSTSSKSKTARLGETPRRLLAVLPQRFTKAQARAAAELAGLSTSALGDHLSTLVKAGFLEKEAQGEYSRNGGGDSRLEAKGTEKAAKREKRSAASGRKIPRATAPQEVPSDAPIDHPALFFNRELSWIDFNWRVLAQAIDERTPLLERARFLAITANNNDEFYRKRVGGLKRQLAAGVRQLSPDGRTPLEQLQLARDALAGLWTAMEETWRDLQPLLADSGVTVARYTDLTIEQQEWLSEYFGTHILPVLTPLAVDPGHPFPFISNQSLSLAVTLRHPQRATDHFARLKVPTGRGRWIRLPDTSVTFVPLEEVVRANAARLFPGMEVRSVSAFRVTRNADIARSEEEAEDLLAMISEELRARRFADIVRLELDSETPLPVRDLLLRELELEAEDVIEVHGLFDLSGLATLVDQAGGGEALLFPRWEPTTPARLRRDGDGTDALFTEIGQGDLLLHHPYDSFTATIQRFIEDAAADPKVIGIKLTLYRTSDDSPIVHALVAAAERGKEVAVLIELKARFDEENNIEWARVLEKAGVHVTYGVVGLKTHAKCCLVVRQENDGLRTYCHIGTGNYNPKTARLYTDIGLLTSDAKIGRDLVSVFNMLTGYSAAHQCERLLLAPTGLRDRFVELIRTEVAIQNGGGKGRIIAKMNAIDDTDIISELYSASQAGVQIDLLIRGHCRLRPGLEGISDNIRVVSIVGRFLEHERIYYFAGNGDSTILIGSADWQRRNLDDRVELLVPVTDEVHREYLQRNLELCLSDNRLAWDLRNDGRYSRRYPDADEAEICVHDQMIAVASGRAQETA